ncbi:MAG: methyltransferase [Rhizomicrobium sp.]
MSESTDDKFLNGRVMVRQPVRGFRSGLDAVMLAAAVPASSGDEVLELGSGSGAVSLCLAARVVDCSVAGIEIDPALTEIANANARTNNVDARVRFVAGNALLPPDALRRSFAHVFSNPPFHGAEGETSPDAARELALRDDGRLGDWFAVGLKRVASGGTFTAIVRADRLADALTALPERGVAIFPLWPRAGEPAKRVVLQATKGSRAPPALLPGLVLHETDGRYTREADAILREGRSLALAKPRL